MSEDDIFKQTNDAYLCLVHPARSDEDSKRKISSVVTLAPSVPDILVSVMISGASWRERLLGICMAVAKQQKTFVEPMLQSLRDPRGIAIVPTCAALAVFAKRGIFSMPKSFSEMFDRQIFDGEIGWATDKAMYYAGLRVDDVSGRGPNYGQVFDDHIKLYNSILKVGC